MKAAQEKKSCSHPQEIISLQESILIQEQNGNKLEEALAQSEVKHQNLIHQNRICNEKLNETEKQLNSLRTSSKKLASLEEESAKLKQELAKKAADITECLKLKNVNYFCLFLD